MNRALAAFGGLFGFGLALAIVLLLATGGPGPAGSSGVPPDAFVARLAPGQLACQGSPPLPGDAALAQIVVGVERGAKAKVGFTARSRGATVARGAVVAAPGVVRLPLRRERGGPPVDMVCLRNAGRSQLAIAGRSGGALRLSGDHEPAPATLSILYVRSDPPSWLSQAGQIAERFSHLRFAPFGTATLWLALALALIGAAGAITSTVLSQRD